MTNWQRARSDVSDMTPFTRKLKICIRNGLRFWYASWGKYAFPIWYTDWSWEILSVAGDKALGKGRVIFVTFWDDLVCLILHIHTFCYALLEFLEWNWQRSLYLVTEAVNIECFFVDALWRLTDRYLWRHYISYCCCSVSNVCVTNLLHFVRLYREVF